MSNRKYDLSRKVNVQEACEFLKKNLNSPKIKGVSLKENKILLKATFYTYKVQVADGHVKVGGSATLVGGISFLLLIGCFLGMTEANHVYKQVYDTLKRM